MIPGLTSRTCAGLRRISVEVKADALLGTDASLEDFYCFAGRVLEHDWAYLGTARLLAVARSRNRETIFGGPSGWVPVDDDWALRTMGRSQSDAELGRPSVLAQDNDDRFGHDPVLLRRSLRQGREVLEAAAGDQGVDRGRVVPHGFQR